MKAQFFILIIGLFFYTNLNIIPQTKKTFTTQKIPIIINKEKRYPKTTFIPKTVVRYIPLETNKDVLLGQGAHIYYLSENRILVSNDFRGDIFIFDLSGKAISNFNVKGGLGCSSISYVVYDEKMEEVFVVDHISRKIVVFAENGSFLRTLHMPGKSTFTEIQNFNDSLLLAFSEHLYGPLEQKHPYMLISKSDGTLVSKLNIVRDKANPKYLVSGDEWTVMSNNYSGNCKFGQEFILFNKSSDKIFVLKQDQTLTPLFVQQPTVFSENPVIVSVGMKTRDFIRFSVYPYNLKEARRKNARGDNRPTDGGVKYLMYEFKTGKFFECNKWGNSKYWAEKVEIPENTCVKLIDSYRLVEHLKLRLLKGDKKEIASKLKIDDNPVVEITKFICE